MKVTIIAEDGPVIYEDASFVEIEAAEPVELIGTNKGGVQIYRHEE
jgi:hypothetical protein